MRQAGGESFRVRGMGGGEHSGWRRDALLSSTVVYVGGCQQPEADVMVLGVVPGEEHVAVRPGVLD